MFSIEPGDMGIHGILALGHFQIGMTPGAGRVCGLGNADFSDMFDVARSARWRKGLARVVGWSIMASEASFVGYGGAIAGRTQVAEVAIGGEHGMSRGEWAHGVDIRLAKHRRVHDPGKR